MNDSATQLGVLIERLWERTQKAQLRWKQITPESYETRLGEYSMLIKSLAFPARQLTHGPISLTVSKLDGSQVANINSDTSTISALLANQPILGESSRSTLTKLYNFVANRNPDLDELLNMLK